MPSLRDAKLKHAQYYVEIANQSDELHVSNEVPQQVGLESFDNEKGQIDETWEWLRQQTPSEEIDILLILFAEATSAIGMLRYSVGYEHIPHFEIQLMAARRLGWQEAEASALSNLGLAYAYLGYHRQAISYFEQALIIAQRMDDQNTVADLQGFLRLAHEQMHSRMAESPGHRLDMSRGDYQAEFTQLLQTLNTAQSSNDHLAEAKILDDLGILHSSIGDYETALLYHERARSIYRRLGHHPATCQSALEMAIAQAYLGNGKQSLEILQPICDYYRENGFANTQILDGIVEVLQQLLPVIEDLDYLTTIGHSKEAARLWKKLEPAFQWLSQAVDNLRRGRD